MDTGGCLFKLKVQFCWGFVVPEPAILQCKDLYGGMKVILGQCSKQVCVVCATMAPEAARTFLGRSPAESNRMVLQQRFIKLNKAAPIKTEKRKLLILPKGFPLFSLVNDLKPEAPSATQTDY